LPEIDQEQTTGSRFTDCILITGYYGFGNTGDEAILASIREELRSVAPGARLIVMSENPAETSARHGVEAFHWSDPVARLDAVERSKLVIIGGGGLFHDYWGLSGTLFAAGTWGFSLYLTVALYAAFRGVPVMLWAVGVGPLFSGLGRATTLAICRLASAITVRDRFSGQELEALGVPKDRIQVTADPVFSTSPVPLMSATVRDIIGQTATGNSPMIGVSVRHWDFAMDASVWEAQVAEALDILARRSGASFVFISYQATGNERLDDVFAARRVHAAMRSGARVTIVPRTLLVEETWALIGACDGMLAMRFHSGVAAATQGVPFVTLSYDPKVTALTNELELPGLNVEIAAVDAARIARVLENSIARGASLHEKLLSASAVLRLRGRENALRAQALLSGGQTPPTARLEDFRTFLGDTLRNQIHLLQAAGRELQTATAVQREGFERRLAEVESDLAESERGKQELVGTLARIAEAHSRLTLSHQQDVAALEARITLLQQQSARMDRIEAETARTAHPDRLRAALRPMYKWLFSEPAPQPEAKPELAQTAAAPEVIEPEPPPPVEEPPEPTPEPAPPPIEEPPPPQPEPAIAYQPLISVVLPVWNHKEFVADAVRSVLAQTWRNLELIVIDDGSEEDLVPNLRDAIGDDPRTLVLRRPHEGLPRTLSAGFRYARGEFFTWTSADNIMKPGMLESLVGFLLRRPEVDLVYADMDLTNPKGEPFLGSYYRVSSQRPEATNQLNLPREVETLGLAQDNFIGACFLYRSETARIVGDYDDSRLGVEDYDYWLRIAEVAQIEHLDSEECLYSYRLHSDSLSGRHAPVIVEEAQDLLRHHRERVRLYQQPFYVAIVVDTQTAGLGLTAANLAIELRRSHHHVGEFDSLKAPELLPPWLPKTRDAKTIVVWFGPAPAWFHELLSAYPGVLYFNWLSESAAQHWRAWTLRSSLRVPVEGNRWSLLPASNVYFEDLLLCLKARGAVYPLWGVGEFHPPLFLYLGPIAESFIDWGAVEALAVAYPAATILFVSTREEHAFDPRTKLASIKYPGTIGSGDWYSYLSRADLLIAPFADDEPGVADLGYDVLTAYLAAGKPVLATSPAQLTGFADMPNARFAESAEFVDAAREAQLIQPDLQLASAYMHRKSPRAFARTLLAAANSQLSEGTPQQQVEKADSDRILVTHTPNTDAESAWRRGLPVLAVINDDSLWTNTADLFVTRYIAPSPALARQFSRAHGIAPSKISVIPNGIDVDRPLAGTGITRVALGLSGEDYVVLQIAPLKSTSAQIHSVAAVEALRERCPQLKLVVVGCMANRQYAAEVESYIQEAGLNDRVLLQPETGCLSDYYRIADAFLLTSLAETATPATLQAMLCGLPLILTNAGGAPGLISGSINDNGLLIPAPSEDGDLWRVSTNRHPDNLEALTSALCEFYGNPEDWCERGKSGEAKVRLQFNTKITAERYTQETNRLLEKHGATDY
jgi:polysaccharide pyruvyl transferase CsaB